MERGNIGLTTKEEDIIPVLGDARHVSVGSIYYDEAVSHLRYLYQDVNDIKQRYVFLGFHLWEFDRGIMWNTLGFSNIFEFAEANLGLDKTTVSRCMAVAKKFSSNGSSANVSMHLDKRYKDFSYSQLCEMVSMDDKDRWKVKPEMTIRQIRELKKAIKETDQNEDSALNSIDSLKNILDAAQHKKSIQKFDQLMKEKCHADQEQSEEVPGQTSIEKDFPEYLPDGQAKPVATSQQNEKKPFEYNKYISLQGAASSAYIKSRDVLSGRHRAIAIHFFDRNGKPVFPEISNLWLDVIYYSDSSYYVRLNKTKEELEGKS
ncbi:MAG: hypothetical protein HDQ98_14540 [Lachnospiraceae bacterium]|nr:hypothetical protein [Lachnospiraceae bacterium]MBD5533391.1 hypothetical protein [Lachnospiraceae bacterium]